MLVDLYPYLVFVYDNLMRPVDASSVHFTKLSLFILVLRDSVNQSRKKQQLK